MGCEKRNKKLFKHIAIGVLILVIIYIIKNTFFTGKNIIEGFGKNILDYEKDAINLKIDKNAKGGAVDATRFGDYVKLYKKQAERKEREPESETADTSADKQDFITISTILSNKLGGDTYRLLDSAIMVDPELSLYQYKKDTQSNKSEEYKLYLRDMFGKIDELYAEMSTKNSTLPE